MSSQQKVVLITGGSSGIGAATAKLYASKGYKVAITGRNLKRNTEVAKACDELSPNKHKTLAIIIDLANLDTVEEAVSKTISEFGQLDVLINSAAICHPVGMMDFKSYRDHMNLNMDSPIKLTMHAIPHIKKTKGNIIFLSSVGGERPVSWIGPYCTTKAGLNVWAACLALELAPEVRVNIINPGAVDTPMLTGIEEASKEHFSGDFIKAYPVGRIGTVDELAKAIYYVSSDDASFMTGSKLTIDGGYCWKN